MGKIQILKLIFRAEKLRGENGKMGIEKELEGIGSGVTRLFKIKSVSCRVQKPWVIVRAFHACMKS